MCERFAVFALNYVFKKFPPWRCTSKFPVRILGVPCFSVSNICALYPSLHYLYSFIFTKEKREHGLVACGGETRGPLRQQPTQSAGVWKQRLLDRMVDSVRVMRGHEAHQTSTCASTSTARWCRVCRVHRGCTLEQLLDLPTAPRRGYPRLLYQPSKRGTSQVISQCEPVRYMSSKLEFILH